MDPSASVEDDSSEAGKKRKGRPANKYDPVWSLHDKQRFVAGMCSGPPIRQADGQLDWKQLSKFIGNKSVYHVKDYAHRINRVENGCLYPEFKDRAAVDVWRDIASTSTTDKTAEFCFPQLLTVAALEPGNNLSSTSLSGIDPTAASSPDLKAVYTYLSAITKGAEPEALAAEEAGVVLELVEDLIRVLSGADPLLQRELMHTRYSEMRQLVYKDDAVPPEPAKKKKQTKKQRAAESSSTAPPTFPSNQRQMFPSMNPFVIPFELLEFDSQATRTITLK